VQALRNAMLQSSALSASCTAASSQRGEGEQETVEWAGCLLLLLLVLAVVPGSAMHYETVSYNHADLLFSAMMRCSACCCALS
jgi:hypothetical protein